MRHALAIKPDRLSRFQSTHPARDATPALFLGDFRRRISIHASREGCDAYTGSEQTPLWDFNPRIPRGMRHNMCDMRDTVQEFQSTHPARDATKLWIIINISNNISIHASREGCDPSVNSLMFIVRNFNPRIPRGMRRYSAGLACGT